MGAGYVDTFLDPDIPDDFAYWSIGMTDAAAVRWARDGGGIIADPLVTSAAKDCAGSCTNAGEPCEASSDCTECGCIQNVCDDSCANGGDLCADASNCAACMPQWSCGGAISETADCAAMAVNATGDTVGFCIDPVYPFIGPAFPSAILWHEGTAEALGPGAALDINESGVAVGFRGHEEYVTGGSFTWRGHGVRWERGQEAAIAPDNSMALGLNERGDVVGWQEVLGPTGRPHPHAMLWRNGEVIDLHTLPNGPGTIAGTRDSRAWDINDRGVVVGAMATSLSEWVWDERNGVRFLAVHESGFGYRAHINDFGLLAIGEGLVCNGGEVEQPRVLPHSTSSPYVARILGINSAGEVAGLGGNNPSEEGGGIVATPFSNGSASGRVRPPTAAASVVLEDVIQGCEGCTHSRMLVTVDGEASHDGELAVQTYAWDFGDGTLVAGRRATHQYQQAGSFPIILTVGAADGAYSTTTKVVRVLPPGTTFCDAGARCDTGQPGACSAGVTACPGGELADAVCQPLKSPTAEICDGVDNDCNGQTDENLGRTTCGRGPCRHTAMNCTAGVPQVCDPLLGAQPEALGDGIDNDCDGFIDESPCHDVDGDGFGDPASPDCRFPEADCNDADPAVHPGAFDTAGDGIDTDCNGADGGQLVLVADRTGFTAGVAAPVRFTASFAPVVGVLPSTISLRREGQSDAAPWCVLRDNGDEANGDMLAGDGAYTCTLAVNEAVPTRLQVVAQADLAEGRMTSNAVIIVVHAEPSQGGLDAIVAVEQHAADLWDTIRVRQGNTPQARDALAASLRQDPAVADARITSDGFNVAVDYAAGLSGTIALQPSFGIEAASSAGGSLTAMPLVTRGVARSIETPCTRLQSAPAGIIRNRRALFWIPFSDDLNTSGFWRAIANLYDQRPTDNPRDAHVCGDFLPESATSGQATLDSVRTFGQYGLVALETHGGTIGRGRAQVELVTGTRCDATVNAQGTTLAGAGYLRRSIIGRECFWAVTAPFFNRFVGRFAEGSVVFIGGCLAGRGDSDIVAALRDKGAAVVYGFDDVVSIRYETSTARDVLGGLVGSTASTDVAFAVAQAVSGAEDPSFGPGFCCNARECTATLCGSDPQNPNRECGDPAYGACTLFDGRHAARFVASGTKSYRFCAGVSFDDNGLLSKQYQFGLESIHTCTTSLDSCHDDFCPFPANPSPVPPATDVSLLVNRTFADNEGATTVANVTLAGGFTFKGGCRVCGPSTPPSGSTSFGFTVGTFGTLRRYNAFPLAPPP